MGGTGVLPKLKVLEYLDAFGAVSFIKCQQSGGKNKRARVKATGTHIYKPVSFPIMFGKWQNKINGAKLSFYAVYDSLTILAISVL